MAASGGVALLAVAAGLMSPPPAPTPRTASSRTVVNATPATAEPPQAPPATLAMQVSPQAMPTAPAVRAAPPPPGNDPTVTLAQAVPQRVPLARDQRDPAALARLEAAAAAPPPAPPAPRGEPDRARVGETDLGQRVLPGSRPVPDSGRRVPDGAGGEAVALSLAGTGSLDAAVQFYRQQLVADGLPADAVQVLRPGNGQALLRAPSPQGGEQTVWIVENGQALDIVLARVRPGPTAQR